MRHSSRRLALVLVPPLALIFLVLGSILTGVATVNQAGAIGAAGALLMASYRLNKGGRSTFLPAIIALASICVIGYLVVNYDTNIKGNLLRRRFTGDEHRHRCKHHADSCADLECGSLLPYRQHVT